MESALPPARPAQQQNRVDRQPILVDLYLRPVGVEPAGRPAELLLTVAGLAAGGGRGRHGGLPPPRPLPCVHTYIHLWQPFSGIKRYVRHSEGSYDTAFHQKNLLK